MRHSHRSSGYTIVEVMIFLAISGFMFVLAAGFINGKQATSEFKQGMNDINSQLTQTINDVANGFYPSSENFNCAANGSGTPTTSAPGNAEKGTNKGCVFVGKILYFPSLAGGSNANQYRIMSVLGRQFTDGNLTPPHTYAQSNATVADGVAAGVIDLSETNTLQWGLSVTGMKDNGTSISGLGFFGSPAGTNVSGNLASGSQTVQMASIQTLNPLTAVGGSGLDTSVTQAHRVVICFDGGTGRFGSITVGDTGQRLGTDIKIGRNAAAVGC